MLFLSPTTLSEWCPFSSWRPTLNFFFWSVRSFFRWTVELWILLLQGNGQSQRWPLWMCVHPGCLMRVSHQLARGLFDWRFEPSLERQVAVWIRSLGFVVSPYYVLLQSRLVGSRYLLSHLLSHRGGCACKLTRRSCFPYRFWRWNPRVRFSYHTPDRLRRLRPRRS